MVFHMSYYSKYTKPSHPTIPIHCFKNRFHTTKAGYIVVLKWNGAIATVAKTAKYSRAHKKKNMKWLVLIPVHLQYG